MFDVPASSAWCVTGRFPPPFPAKPSGFGALPVLVAEDGKPLTWKLDPIEGVDGTPTSSAGTIAPGAWVLAWSVSPARSWLIRDGMVRAAFDATVDAAVVLHHADTWGVLYRGLPLGGGGPSGTWLRVLCAPGCTETDTAVDLPATGTLHGGEEAAFLDVGVGAAGAPSYQVTPYSAAHLLSGLPPLGSMVLSGQEGFVRSVAAVPPTANAPGLVVVTTFLGQMFLDQLSVATVSVDGQGTLGLAPTSFGSPTMGGAMFAHEGPPGTLFLDVYGNANPTILRFGRKAK